MTSSTNTFNGVSPGLTFTVSQAGVDLDGQHRQRRQEHLLGRLQPGRRGQRGAGGHHLADRAGTLSSDGKTRTGQGALSSDTTIKNLTSSVLQAVTSAVGGVSAAKFGIQSTQDGTLTFDADTFNAAYAADPAGAQALVAPVGGTGLAQRLAASPSRPQTR